MAFDQIVTSVTILNSGLIGYNGITLTNFTTSTISAIAEGSSIEVAGAFFKADGDITINSSSWTAIATAKAAYIGLTPSGSAGSQILSAAYYSDVPVWSESKQGWYLSAGSNIRFVAIGYKSGATSQEYKVIMESRQIGVPNTDAVFYGIKTEGVYGIYGLGLTYGVYGSGSTYGVYGSGSTYGVYGSAIYGVRGDGIVTGVQGYGSVYGVYGSGSTYGVFGSGPTGVYGLGNEYGVYGNATNGVRGDGIATGVWGSGSTYGIFGSSSTYGVYGAGPTGVYGIGTTFGVYASGGIYGVYGSGPSGVYGTGTTYGVYGVGPTGVIGYGTVYGVKGDGGTYDFYAEGPGTNYGPFTGGHDIKLNDVFPKKFIPGLIVSCTGKTIKRKDSYSTTLPECELSNKKNDPAVLGVIIKEQKLPKEHWYKPKKGERFGICNALGEGLVLVTNKNGNLQLGDYITSSSIPGYGQKQDDDLLHSYTLGKVTELVDWGSVKDKIQGYKYCLISCVYVSG
jgi:hypothetical protein